MEDEASLKRSAETSNFNFSSPNHPNHPLELFPSDGDWYCDGKNIFGSCKSNINFPGNGIGKKRYKCKVCNSFDLCETCLRAPSNNIVHSTSHAHPLKLCPPGNERWQCDGKTVFGKCKADSKNVHIFNRYKCTVCANFDLCEQCL